MTTTDNANNVGEEQDSLPAGQTDSGTPDTDTAPDSNNGAQDDDDYQGLGQDQNDGTDDGNPNHEAAKWRTKFRDTQRQRDELAAQLAANHQDIVSQIAADIGLPDPNLLAAAGYEMDSFITDGRVDRGAVAAACEDARKRYRIGRSPRSNFQQGRTNGGGAPGTNGWVDAFAPPKT